MTNFRDFCLLQNERIVNDSPRPDEWDCTGIEEMGTRFSAAPGAFPDLYRVTVATLILVR